jgi:hypothetical protein
LLRVLVTMGWSDGSKNARGGRGRQRAKTKEEQRIFDLNFGLPTSNPRHAQISGSMDSLGMTDVPYLRCPLN